MTRRRLLQAMLLSLLPAAWVAQQRVVERGGWVLLDTDIQQLESLRRDRRQ